MIDAIRYGSQMLIPEIGAEGQQKLSAARVLVIGAGGLGCPVLLNLCGLGVGTIRIADGDVVALSNLHRQYLYPEEAVGQPKALVARDVLRARNSTLHIEAVAERFTEQNAPSLIRGMDLIIDCTDNIQSRYCIDSVAQAAQLPFVYGAVRRFEGQVSVFHYRGGPSFRTLFPDPAAFEGVQDCAVAGIAAFTTSIIGSLQVHEAVKIILGSEEVLSGFVLTVDLSTYVMRKWKFDGENTK